MSDRRYRLTVEYEGTDFSGWQWQPHVRTVQAVMESALKTIFKQDIRVHGSGRTDAGVHALGQVAHFDAPARFEAWKLHNALNGNLPPDVKIASVCETEPTFHARHSAQWRYYHYRIFTGAEVLERRFGWHPLHPLDFGILNRLAKQIRSKVEHDFTAFACNSDDDNEPAHGCRCRIYAAGWELLPHEFRFHIVANRFLRHMVRSLIGAMVDVARNHYSQEWFAKMLHEAPKSDLIFNAPARGLCLNHVGYGEYPCLEENSEVKLTLSI